MQVRFRSMMVLSSLLAIALPFLASAQTPQARTRVSLTPRLNNGATIDEITQSPLPGLFDVRVGRDVMYGDETGTFHFARQFDQPAYGSEPHARARRSLAQDRREADACNVLRQ